MLTCMWPAQGVRSAKVKSAKRMWVRARKLSPDTEARFRSYGQIGGRRYNYGHSLWQCNLRNELMRSRHALDEEEDLILAVGTFSISHVGSSILPSFRCFSSSLGKA